MSRTIVGIAIATVIAVGVAWAVDEKKEDAENPTKVAMKKINRKGGHAVVANNELKAEKPDWDKMAAAAKAITPLAESMAKAKPTRPGQSEKWTELTKAYVESAKEFEKAVDAKDKAAATKAFAGLTQCATCHRVFAQYSPNKMGDE